MPCFLRYFSWFTSLATRRKTNLPRLGSSEFYATPQGKIYALIPSGGKFELKGVRADKFKVLSPGGYRGRNVGIGESAVYCGNLAMRGVNPARA